MKNRIASNFLNRLRNIISIPSQPRALLSRGYLKFLRNSQTRKLSVFFVSPFGVESKKLRGRQELKDKEIRRRKDMDMEIIKLRGDPT